MVTLSVQMAMTNVKKYLFWFAQEHIDFRRAEIAAICSLFNILPRKIESVSDDAPYWIVELDNEQNALDIASRSVSLKCCVELWARSYCHETLHQSLKDTLKATPAYSTYFKKDLSFKITVETFCKHLTLGDKVNKIEEFSYIPFEGPVKLNNPDVEFLYCEYYGLDSNNIPNFPTDMIFGRLVCMGKRSLISELSLKKRKFIGNTSMDAQLSVLAANQALVQEGSIVLDPFVGTGSLLVAAAMFKGYVLGTDIDYLMLHGRTRPSRISQKVRETDESVLANMKQYSCASQYLDVVVADCSLPLWRSNIQIDAIITDPPYGIREAVERVGVEKNKNKACDGTVNSNDDHKEHFPAKIEYNLPSLYSDLLEFSSVYLREGGRLVCWFPVYREDYHEAILPQHDQLRLIANSEQILSQYTARRMLTYEKTTNQCSEITSLHVNETSVNIVSNKISDFRQKYFAHSDETRQEKRMKKASEKERGRLEKLKRELINCSDLKSQ